ncbi:MAG: DNA mismatch repair endonuclease MutL [Myxococcales bacterium]|nr:DNA mismatch repair endonuclease MutL [Myxococcales bacterium]
MNAPHADGRIHQLDPVVANQIAAGEVVERPSSVVKELLENSLDAGAKSISIHLEDGGKALIRIVDDGHGMGPRDAHLAFERHATSKLVGAEELMRLGSYGFRGEALASILSVAKVSLRTRRAGDELGTCLDGGGTRELRERPIACAVGTDLRIASLFFNVPARQKFLRTAATELGHVIRLLDAVALSDPTLQLSLSHNGRKISDFAPVETLGERAAMVFESDVTPHLYAVRGTEDYAVSGQLSAPQITRGSASGLVLLVNGRLVRDKTLQHAVVQAYGELLERRRFPVGVLRLTCPPGTVDVNVHPAKTEVRFVSSQAVHRAVGRAVREMLAAQPWLGQDLLGEAPGTYRPHATAPSGRPFVGGRSGTQPVAQPRSQPFSLQSPRAPGNTWQRPASPTQRQPSGGGPRIGKQVFVAPQPASWAPPETSPGSRVPQVHPVSEAQANRSGRDGAEAIPSADQTPKPIGRISTGLWVYQRAGDVLFVDQHAVDEWLNRKLIDEKLQGQGLAKQRLLMPKIVPVGPDSAAAVLAQAANLQQFGFEVAGAGERALMLRAFPDILPPARIEAVIRDLAARALSGEQGEAIVAAVLACHCALTHTQQPAADWHERLSAELGRRPADLDQFCPHDRRAVTAVPEASIGRGGSGS